MNISTRCYLPETWYPPQTLWGYALSRNKVLPGRVIYECQATDHISVTTSRIRTGNLPADIVVIMCSQRCSCIETGKRCANDKWLIQHKQKSGVGKVRQAYLLTFFAKRQSVCVSKTTVGSSPLSTMSKSSPKADRTYCCSIAWAHNNVMRGLRSNDVPPDITWFDTWKW